MSRHSGRGTYVSVSPDPTKFTIVEIIEGTKNTYADVVYPNCTNYEGRKILLFRGRVGPELRRAKTLDPHFSRTEPLAPIARFEPTRSGADLALSLLDRDV